MFAISDTKGNDVLSDYIEKKMRQRSKEGTRKTLSFELLGEKEKRSMPSEEPKRQNERRSLVAQRDIPEGKQIQPEDIT